MYGYISFFTKFQEGLNMNTYMLFILICTNVIAHPCFPFPTISCLYSDQILNVGHLVFHFFVR